MATDAVYEAARIAAAETYHERTGLRPVAVDHYVHVYAHAAVDAVWALGVAEGRRQAAEAIRADVVAQPWLLSGEGVVMERAARIAAGEQAA